MPDNMIKAIIFFIHCKHLKFYIDAKIDDTLLWIGGKIPSYFRVSPLDLLRPCQQVECAGIHPHIVENMVPGQKTSRQTVSELQRFQPDEGVVIQEEGRASWLPGIRTRHRTVG